MVVKSRVDGRQLSYYQYNSIVDLASRGALLSNFLDNRTWTPQTQQVADDYLAELRDIEQKLLSMTTSNVVRRDMRVDAR